MPTLPPAMLALLAPFAPLFGRRVWPFAVVLVVGTLLAPGKRTVTAALRVLGLAPLLLDLEAVQDTDHVVSVFKLRGHWGAIAKSNFSGLRFREPVYRSVRELVMSYFESYINLRGERTLRAYSRPVNLARFDRSHRFRRRRRRIDLGALFALGQRSGRQPHWLAVQHRGRSAVHGRRRVRGRHGDHRWAIRRGPP